MNQNTPYGQPMPMQPPQRRHDGSYPPIPPHMRSHTNYQPYYPQQMGPMMPQYPQQYTPNWYPYQQHQIHPYHQQRPQYYHQPHMPPPPTQYPPHHGPLVVSSQPPHVQASPRPTHQPPLPPPSLPLQPPSSTSTSSTAPVQTPPSPPLSNVSPIHAKKDVPLASTSPAPPPARSPSADLPLPRVTFFPPVPWFSVEEGTFPRRATRQKRRIPRSLLASEPREYPVPEQESTENDAVPRDLVMSTHPQTLQGSEEKKILPTPIQTPTPLPSEGPSDTSSTQPTTPSSSAPITTSKSEQTPTQPKTRPVIPIVPALPVLPQSPNAARKTHRDSTLSSQSQASDTVPEEIQPRRTSAISSTGAESEHSAQPNDTSKPGVPSTSQPKSWANLFRSAQTSSDITNQPTPSVAINGLGGSKSETLSDVLNEINSTSDTSNKITLLQPRGLVNTGNMCYMNSVLQVLVFSIPFYDFLSKLARRAAYSFKSDTPLIDAIILFVQEYPAIDSATSVEQLRLRLKPDDYEKYGEPFIPEYVYTAIKHLPRFREMRRGHQQDAQEFLGFLLEELHEECARVMRSGTASSSGRTTPLGGAANSSDIGDDESGWMEVGHKQKPAVTRSSGGHSADSPVTNIFGGKLRSELKVSGNRLSVTLEPYSPLQLDIGSPEVHNIVDALKGLTRPESMQGDFPSARGHKPTATKQVFIETLPTVLILHLKRFHYDNTTKRAEKIWRQIGYPLELEIPKEVFPVQARNKYAARGALPKYRLTGVIYHHGKYANGGHYTVDIRRQDGREWIRIDDTLIRRIRSEDVAEGGSEEDPKILAIALERHNNQGKQTQNIFDHIDKDEEEEERSSDKVWSQVNGHSRTKSTMSVIGNGTATPSRETSAPETPSQKFLPKDNKVAYLLFYQRIAA